MTKKYKDVLGDGGSDIIGQVIAQSERLSKRMALIRYKVAVMSGKGGVGKSTIMANLAAALASQGYRVGVLDADINGPTMAKMLGVRAQPLHIYKDAVSPALGPLNIKVMSMDLLLSEDRTPVVWKAPDQQNSFVWRGTMEATTLREFLADTAWGKLDFLLLDLPPGTHAFSTLAQLIPDLTGIVVSIPSGISRLVVNKFVTLAQEMKVPLVGLLENMTSYICPHCGKPADLYTADLQQKIASETGIPHLGGIPFDPRLSMSGDLGLPFVLEHGHSPAGEALVYVSSQVKRFLGENEQ